MTARRLSCAMLAALMLLGTIPPAHAQSLPAPGGACPTAGIWTASSVTLASGYQDFMFCGSGLTWNSPVIYLNSSGNVGIGTTSPSNTLEVYGSGATVNIQNTGSYAYLNFTDASGQTSISNNGTILLLGGATAGSQINFRSGASYSTTMLLTTGGSLGIGSTSPVSSLDLSQKKDAVALPVGTTGQRPTGTNGMIRYNSTTPAVEAYVNGAWDALALSGGSLTGSQYQIATFTGTNAASGNANLKTDASNDLLVTSGSVGIGTTSPGSLFQVKNSTYNWNSYLSLTDGTKTAYMGLCSSSGGLCFASGGGSFNVYDSTHTNSQFYIDASAPANSLFVSSGGSVGIGTTSVPNLLTIGTGGWNAAPEQSIRIMDSGYAEPSADNTRSNGDKLVLWNTSSGGNYFKHAIGVGPWEMWFQSSGNPSGHITFWTGPTAGAAPIERLRIDAYGNVGIGTTSPQATLDVNGNIRVSQSGGQLFGDQWDQAATPSFSWPSSTNTGMWLVDGSSQIGLESSGTTLLFVGPTNVGIGSSSPNASLDLGSGFIEWGGESRVTSTFSVSSNTTLAPITGLSSTLAAGKTYSFEINLYTTGATTGGIKVDLSGGTATATSIIGQATSFQTTTVQTGTRIAALNTVLCSSASATAAFCQIFGTITVNAGGTFIPRFAQNTSNTTASTVAVGSIMMVQQIN